MQEDCGTHEAQQEESEGKAFTSEILQIVSQTHSANGVEVGISLLRERSLVVECWSPKPAVKVRFLPLLPEICRHRLVGLGRQVLILEIRGSNPLRGTTLAL